MIRVSMAFLMAIAFFVAEVSVFFMMISFRLRPTLGVIVFWFSFNSAIKADGVRQWLG